VISRRRLLNASIVILKTQNQHYQNSCRPTILEHKRDNASPAGIGHTGVIEIPLASTNTPLSSRTQMPIPILLNWSKKSGIDITFKTLPRFLPTKFSRTWSNFVVVGEVMSLASLKEEAARVCCGSTSAALASLWGVLAKLQSSIKWKAQSITSATVSVRSCQSFRLQCFHKLHKREPQTFGNYLAAVPKEQRKLHLLLNLSYFAHH